MKPKNFPARKLARQIRAQNGFSEFNHEEKQRIAIARQKRSKKRNGGDS